MKILAIFNLKSSAKIEAIFLIKCKQKTIGPCAYYHSITFLIVQCVSKMIQVSNQLLQRGATEILNKPLL